MVVDELGRMGRIVADITTFVSMEDPGFLRKERVPLDGFVSEVAARAAPLLGDRLAVGASTDRATISADPQRLTQAVINLLDNAAVHTTGSVQLSLARDDGAWRFDVTDEGGGLPAGREMELFEPFVRGNTSAQGSGLGLAIVRRIAEAHGGSAGVENRPGRGATFWIRLPGSVPV
jgi:signal transduction histidine kinase